MDDLDRILSEEEWIEPSSGLTDRVMRAVLEEAEAPPLAFPWWRFALGIGSCLALLLVGLVSMGSRGLPDVAPLPLGEWISSGLLSASVGLPTLTLALTYVAVHFSLRVTR